LETPIEIENVETESGLINHELQNGEGTIYQTNVEVTSDIEQLRIKMSQPYI